MAEAFKDMNSENHEKKAEASFGASDPKGMNATCKILDWDSSFFGRRIARLDVRHLTSDTLTKLNDWVVEQQIECVYFLCEAVDSESIALAEQNRFHLTDIRMTLENRSCIHRIDLRENLVVSQASFEQIAALKGIARSSHMDSRFYQDPHFQVSRCGDLYETWVEKSCKGYAEMVFTAELGGIVAGYVTCHLDSDLAGHIGLLAVADIAQGKGVGSSLVLAALNWFKAQQRSLVTVVTQGRNIRAQRFYQRCGFVSRSVGLWYHYWPAN